MYHKPIPINRVRKMGKVLSFLFRAELEKLSNGIRIARSFTMDIVKKYANQVCLFSKHLPQSFVL